MNVGKPALRQAIEHLGLTRRYSALAILDDDTVIEPGFIDTCRSEMTPGVAIAVGQTVTRWTTEPATDLAHFPGSRRSG